jgi:tetratricopeptide (TPR) repeat protein
MSKHAQLLETVPDAELRGMWLMWHCLATYIGNEFAAALEYAERSIALGEEAGSAKVVAYANAQKAWTLLLMGRCTEGAIAGDKALSLVGQLTDERDVTYVSFKAGSGAAIDYSLAGDLFKARARARDLMDFAQASESRRALAMAHYAIGVTELPSGDEDRVINEYTKAYEVVPDTSNRLVIGTNLSFALAGAGRTAEARAVIGGQSCFDAQLLVEEPAQFFHGIKAQRSREFLPRRCFECQYVLH